MRLSFILLFTFCAFSAAAGNGVVVNTKDNIPYFDSVKVQKDKITIVSKSRIGKIKSNEPDDVKIWDHELDFSKGDTVRVIGGQINLYWQILEIARDKAKIHYYGFERGIGTVGEIFWIKGY